MGNPNDFEYGEAVAASGGLCLAACFVFACFFFVAALTLAYRKERGLGRMTLLLVLPALIGLGVGMFTVYTECPGSHWLPLPLLSFSGFLWLFLVTGLILASWRPRDPALLALFLILPVLVSVLGYVGGSAVGKHLDRKDHPRHFRVTSNGD